jgi:hypothetical protein
MPCISMERPERYDPEDIEHLLSERPFHQLLAEEKAYVLRHIGDAEEYERMRALLLHLREDEQQREPLMPDAASREQVMAAFRAQQRPVWRVWLNSVAAVFAQEHEGFAWRPALALAGVATVLVVGVAVVYRASFNGQEQLAEVVPPKQDQQAPAAATEGAVEAESTETASNTEQVMVEAEEGAPVEVDVRTVAPSVERAEEDALPASYEALPSVAEKAAADVAGFAAVAADDEQEVAEELSLDAVTAVPQANDHRVVREGELARNSSVGNATGVVSAKEVSAKRRSSAVVVDRSRSVADDPELLALLRAGW